MAAPEPVNNTALIARTTKPEPNPEWEAKAKTYHDEATAEAGIDPFATLTMLERWKSDAEPANEHGQVSFSRAMLDSAADALRFALEISRNEHLRAEAAEARLRTRVHPAPDERMSRAVTFDHVTSDEFVTTLREAHQDLDDAMNDLDEAKGALEESDRKNDRLREVLRLVVRTGCGCHPICQCEEPGSLAIWKEEIVSAARSALNAAQDEDSPAQADDGQDA